MCRTQAGPQVPLSNDEKASNTFPNLGIRVLLDKIVGIPGMPHDGYCPSVLKNLERRVCPQCGNYYPSIAALKRHHRGAACAYDSNDDERDSGLETEVIEKEARANEDTAPIVNIFELLRNPAFTELDGNNDDEDYFTNQNTRTTT